MKEIKFEYTKILSTVAVIFLTILVFILPFIFGMKFHANFPFLVSSSLVVGFVSFYFLKRLIVLQGQALLDENSVTFVFKDNVKKVDFDSLTSYNIYLGINISIIVNRLKSECPQITALVLSNHRLSTPEWLLVQVAEFTR